MIKKYEAVTTEVGARRYEVENIPRSKSYLEIRYTSTVNRGGKIYRSMFKKI